MFDEHFSVSCLRLSFETQTHPHISFRSMTRKNLFLICAKTLIRRDEIENSLGSPISPADRAKFVFHLNISQSWLQDIQQQAISGLERSHMLLTKYHIHMARSDRSSKHYIFHFILELQEVCKYTYNIKRRILENVFHQFQQISRFRNSYEWMLTLRAECGNGCAKWCAFCFSYASSTKVVFVCAQSITILPKYISFVLLVGHQANPQSNWCRAKVRKASMLLLLLCVCVYRFFLCYVPDRDDHPCWLAGCFFAAPELLPYFIFNSAFACMLGQRWICLSRILRKLERSNFTAWHYTSTDCSLPMKLLRLQ